MYFSFSKRYHLNDNPVTGAPLNVVASNTFLLVACSNISERFDLMKSVENHLSLAMGSLLPKDPTARMI
ncbi:MAG: hypothetical protein WCJ45_01050 [bacterium]